MIILGVTAPLSWNNAAAIIKNGKFLAAIEEERLNRIKHAPRMAPFKSTKFCLEFAKVKLSEIDYIAVGYRSPMQAFLLSALENCKQGNFNRLIRELGAFAEYYVEWQRYKEWLEKKGVNFKHTKIIYVPHHLAHAASTFRCSGFDTANIITLDGQGEDDAGMLGIGQVVSGKLSVVSQIKLIEKINHHQSLGWIYGDTTSLLGFKSHSHEGKVMALASFGKKLYDFSGILKVWNDGYKLEKNWWTEFAKKFGPPRLPFEELKIKHKNLAKTSQVFLEKAGMALARKIYDQTTLTNFCLAGGVVLNCDMNSCIKNLPFVKNIFIQPASNDAGCAIGAALEIANRIGENADFYMQHAYWGQEFTNTEIEKILKEAKVKYQKIKNVEKFAALKIQQGKIVGWFQGRSEIGPRALGNRSILAHPAIPGMKEKINQQVKHRENWRPFSPSILHEFGHEYFDNYILSPFMLLTFKTKINKQKELSQAIHIDHTARIQSVTKVTNLKYHKLISEFYKLTNIPAVLNTSFNDNEQPLVNTPKEALQVFSSTGMDILVMGDYVIDKKSL